MQPLISSKELEVLQTKYPGNVFVYVNPAGRAADLPALDKHKYIVPKSTTVGMFSAILRRRMNVPPEKAIFLFIDNNLPTSSSTMGELSTLHGKNGYLEVMYAGENTFGHGIDNGLQQKLSYNLQVGHDVGTI